MKQPNKFGYFIKNNLFLHFFLQITKNQLMDFTNYTSKFIRGIPKNKYC